MAAQLAEASYIGDLGHGLIRRWSTAGDQAKIGLLVGTVYRHSPDEPFDVSEADELRVIMGSTFPFMDPTDFAVVEDTSRPERPIVASTGFFRHQWSYAGVRFGVGRPEDVATDPQYRQRGLIRALFEMIHARSAAEGHLVQAITGIPYFYRQFGYEYVLDLGGHRVTNVADVPPCPAGAEEPYRLRPATLDDVPDLSRLYNQRRHTSLVWHEAPEALWRHYIVSWDDPALAGRDLRDVGLLVRLYMVEDATGRTAGFVRTASKRRGGNLTVSALELAPTVNWQTAMPALLRALTAIGHALPGVRQDNKPLTELRCRLGREHPVYAVLGDALAPHGERPYAWYLRVPDVSRFIQQIAPVLEERLANSLLTGYTGDLKFDQYRGGLRLRFEQGKLSVVEPWDVPIYGESADAGCPPLTFLQLLFGFRDLATLRTYFPDVWANDEAALLINTLFPALPSAVSPLA